MLSLLCFCPGTDISVAVQSIVMKIFMMLELCPGFMSFPILGQYPQAPRNGQGAKNGSFGNFAICFWAVLISHTKILSLCTISTHLF